MNLETTRYWVFRSSVKKNISLEKTLPHVMNRVRTKQIIREQRAVINTDVLGLALRVSVCRTVVHPNQTNTVTLSSWLKIKTAETMGTQNTH